MAVFKCKMCGGALEVNNETVAVCQYCGTKQTLPKLDDERKANLYDRANHFRRNNEFDKAMGIYEQILNDDNTDAESYWSLVLCRYGIEYVEDPSSRKRIPTVNRAQFTSIYDDEDYKSALQYADGYQKDVYEQEANAINDIQKGILAISNKEEPFDVFICYKETDANGRRTPDSVLATELYHELTREGFKVFFSRVTLEDKLGQEYEPYIFAALNSAKVMVVLGTRPEYFNAVWVKNEWSRYLALIKNGARKILIPAYRDMDPYNLPEEFSHLQAQDMSKLGFMQDLVLGIKKMVSVQKIPVVAKESSVNRGNNIEILLKRAFWAVEDGEWKKAEEFAEQILSVKPECADAYLIKLMVDMKTSNLQQLEKCKKTFVHNLNYKKAVRFGYSKLEILCKNNIKAIQNQKKKMKRIITPIIACVVLCAILLIIFSDIIPRQKQKNFIANFSEGSEYITFGSYEQDNDMSNGKEDVEWLVLEVKNGKALLISKYALDCRSYHSFDVDTSWEECSLREWLNDDFYKTAFSAWEKDLILTTDIYPDKNPHFYTESGNATEDKVFLLSADEAEKYFSLDSAKKCTPTSYAVANGVWSANSACYWWLRTPGKNENLAMFIGNSGSSYISGKAVDATDMGVRPALWIELNP